MQLSPEISGFTNQMVADCALASSSIFFYDDNAGQAHLSYLYHVGVCQEAQHRYEQARVFESDPFTRQLLAHSELRGHRFVSWGDAALDRFVARDYTTFLEKFAVDVVGASTRRLAPGVCLIIGAHQRHDGQRRGEVPMALLRNRIQTLSDMVVDSVLEDIVGRQEGRLALRSTLGSVSRAVFDLSPREEQLAGLICRGLQNKAIAFEMGLSEYTVENYARRLYRKLDVRNRAGLVSRMNQRLH